jgi:hypothetical protein
MLKHHSRPLAAAVAAAIATAIAVTGITTASATPRTTFAVSGTEHFQAVTASATSSTQPVIAYGVFTAGGTDHQGSKVDTFVFPTGSFKVTHSKGAGTVKVNPKTCLVTASLHGTITISGGTGAYAGISGHGTYQASVLAIDAQPGGKCSQTMPPITYEQTIKASGPISP